MCVPYVYHPQQAILGVKTRVQNVYHHHMAFLEVKTCFQMVYCSPTAFPELKMRLQNIYNRHTTFPAMCTEHLIVSHILSWGQNAFPERLPSSHSLSWSHAVFLPSSQSHCRGEKGVYQHLYHPHIAALHVKTSKHVYCMSTIFNKPFQMSKCVCEMCTICIIIPPFWKSKHISRWSTILHQLFLWWKCASSSQNTCNNHLIVWHNISWCKNVF